MAFDISHIQALEQAITAAQQALAAAVTPEQRAAAQVALDNARAALKAAWDTYYTEVLVTADQLLGTAKTSDVLGLFPVALEAKLEPAQHRLRLRVLPDPFVQSTHDPALTTAEQAAGQRYWTAEAAAITDADHLAAWKALAGDFGPQRAAWIARTLTPTNVASLASGAAPVFPQVTLEDPANPFVPTAAMLPDCWVVLGYRAGARVIVHVGQPITRLLVTGLDTTAAALAAVHNVDGAPIQLPPRMRWMVDFPAAGAAGMAMEIPVPADLDQIDQLYVFGVRSGGAAAGRDELEQLFTGHRYGRGLAFVPQQTPTNNSPSGPSGLPSPTDAITQAFMLERKPRAYSSSATANGQQTANALGIAPEVLATMPYSGAVPEGHFPQVFIEPDGLETFLERALRTVLWMPVAGHFFEDLIGLDAAQLDALRNHFIENVSATGSVPVIRVGDQPYGILPVTAVHSFRPTSGENIDPMLVSVLGTISSILDDNLRGLEPLPDKDALFITGRPRTFIEAQMAPRTPFDSEWVNLAGQLNQRSNGAIPTSWAQGPLKALDGQWVVPPGMTFDEIQVRPLCDAETPPALESLATTRPDTIRASAPSGSVLARIARYATLLEWALFARTVGEAALQGTSFLDGARTAAATNRALWLDLLLYAFHPVGTPPFPVDAPSCQKVVNLVGSLDRPSDTCPGQRRLVLFRAALHVLSQVPRQWAPQLEAFTYSVLGLGDLHYYYAWQTSLATSRLRTLRNGNAFGMVVGGFGWLQDVRAASRLPAFTAEFIHAPSHDQAAAAAVLRSAALRADDAASSHANIDLSSRRVRLAHWLMNGVRNGRQLKELLGARFERRLCEPKEAGGAALLPQLRHDFPGGLVSGILDGLALRAAPPANANDAFKAALAELNDSFDALADAFTAEAVYQLVHGNPARALFDIDDMVRGGTPPTLEITESPKLGTRITHRVAAVIPSGQAAPGWPVVHTPRTDSDPILNAWCGSVLGHAAGNYPDDRRHRWRRCRSRLACRA